MSLCGNRGFIEVFRRIPPFPFMAPGASLPLFVVCCGSWREEPRPIPVGAINELAEHGNI